MSSLLKDTKSIYIGLIIGFIIMFLEHSLLHSTFSSILTLFVLFAFIIYAALNVAHSAEKIAHILGEAKGMLVLTLSAVSVEVVVIVMMLLSGADGNIVKDTIFYAILLDVSGIIGLSMYFGGKKHNIQKFNFDSTNYYILAIVFVVALSMMTPSFLNAQNISLNQNFFIFEIFMLLCVGVFLYKQMLWEHKSFFSNDKSNHDDEEKEAGLIKYSIILILNIIVIGFLSELLGAFIDPQIEAFCLPKSVAAILVAIISASPELITAVNAARDDKMQIPINIAFGASFATAVFTILVMQTLALFGFFTFSLALSTMQIFFLCLLLAMLLFIFNDDKTHKGEGFFLLAYLAVVIYFSFSGYL